MARIRDVAVGLGVAALLVAPCAHAAETSWGAYGGDAGGQRYSAAAQITPQNVRGLKVAWTYSTGEMARHGADIERASFENTPILAGGRLYICSPFDAVSAVDPGTGEALWQHDPKVDPKVRYPNDCRSISDGTPSVLNG